MTLYACVRPYLNFVVNSKRVAVPYCIVEEEAQRTGTHYAVTTKHRHFAGKGSPQQLLHAVTMAAQAQSFSLSSASPDKIREFMIDQGIGVDCSGFVYTVLNRYLSTRGEKSLDEQILRYPGLIGKLERRLLQKNRVRRSSADTLTNNLNTFPITTVAEIQEGDLIRLTPLDWRGKHVLLVVRVTPQCIFYAHSSANTKVDGPHVSAIRITDPRGRLEDQVWLEKTKHGKNYGAETFRPENGDGVRRLRFWPRYKPEQSS